MSKFWGSGSPSGVKTPLAPPPDQIPGSAPGKDTLTFLVPCGYGFPQPQLGIPFVIGELSIANAQGMRHPSPPKKALLFLGKFNSELYCVSANGRPVRGKKRDRPIKSPDQPALVYQAPPPAHRSSTPTMTTPAFHWAANCDHARPKNRNQTFRHKCYRFAAVEGVAACVCGGGGLCQRGGGEAFVAEGVRVVTIGVGWHVTGG